MCLTLAGRLQTRAITLTHGWILAILFASLTGSLRYFTLFFMMAGVTLLLDVLVYNQLIRFQPRWLTLLLGGVEFFILALIAFDPEAIGPMLVFYVPVWLMGWLTMEIVLPRMWPRWAEDGGEFQLRS